MTYCFSETNKNKIFLASFKDNNDVARWLELDKKAMSTLDGSTLTLIECEEYEVLSRVIEAAGLKPNCPCHGAQNGWLAFDASLNGNWGKGHCYCSVKVLFYRRASARL